MEYLPTILLILIAFIVVALYFKKNRSNNDSSQELLIQLNESLRKEIQDIRKEVGDNAEKGRQEIENKLKDINKEVQTPLDKYIPYKCPVGHNEYTNDCPSCRTLYGTHKRKYNF